jgi:putative thioredoxin
MHSGKDDKGGFPGFGRGASTPGATPSMGGMGAIGFGAPGLGAGAGGPGGAADGGWAPQGAGGGHVVDVTVESFREDVVERSRRTLVLVDLWASWCGPCKTLGPTLEKVAADLGGKVVLAKVDVDANPEIAEIFGAQSIPTVVLIKDGRPIDGFVGAQTEGYIKEMLKRHLPAAAVDPLIAALELEQQGDILGAMEALRELADADKPTKLARAHLARMLAQNGAIDEARTEWQLLPQDDVDSEPARTAKALLALEEQKVDLGPLEAAVAKDAGDLKAQLALGKGLLAAGRTEEGLDRLYQVCIVDLKFEGGAPRLALLEAFDALGPTNPLAIQYRRKLSILLCS